MSSTLTISPSSPDLPFASREELEARLASEYGAHLAILDQRLDDALRATGFDGAVIFAGDERVVFRDDQTYPFRVEPYFKAWVPLTQAPGSFLRLVPGQKPMLVYKQVEDYWHEPPRDPEGYWTQHFDIRIAHSDAEARKLSGSGARWVAIGSGAERAVQRGGHTALPAINDPRFLNHLDFTRAVKTTYELLCMRAAQATAVRGHLAVAAAFESGATELDLHNRYLAASGQRETELPYPNIIALNEHAATLHFTRLRAEAPPVIRSLLIDAGAEFNGYAADVTRTYSASGTDDFSALIASMDALQQRICEEVKPGADFVVLHAFANRQLTTVLSEHRIVTCSADEAVSTGITRAFLPHGLGHLLGLQVHDAGGRLADRAGRKREPPPLAPYLRLTRTLEPGVVTTIEPGLYFIPSLLKPLLAKHEDKLNRAMIERLVPFGGIRIEDNVEVTADGHRNLTRDAFAAALRGNGRPS
jgi:Xaa-Pro dipeptidase